MLQDAKSAPRILEKKKKQTVSQRLKTPEGINKIKLILGLIAEECRVQDFRFIACMSFILLLF